MTQNGKLVQWADGDTLHTFPLRWLGFECPCPDCRVEQTAERRWLPSGFDQFEAQTIESSSTGIDITWTSGHRSRFDAAQLRASLAVAERARVAPVPWAPGSEPQRFDHAEVMSDKAAMVSFMQCFRDEGTALLTGTPMVSEQLESTMAILGLPLRELFRERIHNVFVDPAGYNIAHTNEALPPHSDYASYSHPPSGQVLHMLVNECSGGDSFIVDGWTVASELRRTEPELFEALATVAVPFRMYSSDRESFARQPIIRLGVDGEIAGFRYSNQLRQPLHPADRMFEPWADAYLALTAALTDPSNQRRFRLSSGDALFVHGHRVLHGRTEFVVDGKRHLQDCYFDFDDLLARVDRLTGLADIETIEAH